MGVNAGSPHAYTYRKPFAIRFIGIASVFTSYWMCSRQLSTRCPRKRPVPPALKNSAAFR